MTGELLTLREILAELHPTEERDLATIARRLHRRQGYVRRGLLRLVERRGVYRTETAGQAPTYSRLVAIETFPDETVPPAGASRAAGASGVGDGPAVLTGRYAKPTDPLAPPPRSIEGLRLDDKLIAAMRGVYFNLAFDYAKAAGEKSGGKIPAIVAIAIQEQALRDAADMCRSRIDVALTKQAKKVPA